MAAPASAGLILLREPLVALLYQRGQFDARMTGLVAWALLWFAAGLVGHAMLEVLTRAFYAQRDTRTPVLVGASAMGLNVLLSIVFSALFARGGWMPHGGLALANSLATAVETGALFVLMRRRLGGMEGRRIGQGAAYAALGTAALCAAVIPYALRATSSASGVIGAVALGGSVYFAVMWLLRVPELNTLLQGARRRIRG